MVIRSHPSTLTLPIESSIPHGMATPWMPIILHGKPRVAFPPKHGPHDRPSKSLVSAFTHWECIIIALPFQFLVLALSPSQLRTPNLLSSTQVLATVTTHFFALVTRFWLCLLYGCQDRRFFSILFSLLHHSFVSPLLPNVALHHCPWHLRIHRRVNSLSQQFHHRRAHSLATAELPCHQATRHRMQRSGLSRVRRDSWLHPMSWEDRYS